MMCQYVPAVPCAGGVVLPDMAIIYVAGGSEGAQGLGFWKVRTSCSHSLS